MGIMGKKRYRRVLKRKLKIIHDGETMGKRGISPVISMVIITATLLVILVIASFFATNLLEIQMQNSEFEQAKTAMLLLDKIIMDVSLRPGAASSVQFNQRSGGIGVYEGGLINITISNSSHTYVNSTFIIKYRGGSMVSAANMSLAGFSRLIARSLSEPLGYIRVETGNGAWVVLDYNRVRVIENSELKTVDIYLIKLEPGAFGGSGTVTVRVQNKGINVTPILLSNPAKVTVRVEVNGSSEFYTSTINVALIRVTVVTIKISVM